VRRPSSALRSISLTIEHLQEITKRLYVPCDVIDEYHPPTMLWRLWFFGAAFIQCMDLLT